MTKLDAEIEAILLEADGTDDYDALMEKWSDAARAASAAARRAKGSGGNWRKAARQTYLNTRQGSGLAVRSAASDMRKAAKQYGKLEDTQGAKFGKRAIRKTERFEQDNGGVVDRFKSRVANVKSRIVGKTPIYHHGTVARASRRGKKLPRNPDRNNRRLYY